MIHFDIQFFTTRPLVSRELPRWNSIDPIDILGFNPPLEHLIEMAPMPRNKCNPFHRLALVVVMNKNPEVVTAGVTEAEVAAREMVAVAKADSC